MKGFEPKTIKKEVLTDFCTKISLEDIQGFENHTLNEFVEPLIALEAKEPGSAFVRVTDKEGNIKEILDATAMNWTLNLGFVNPDVCFAVYEQMKRLTHVRYNVLTPVRAKLVKKLANLAPGKLRGGRVSINCEGGGLANEAALKLALISSKGADHFGVFWGAYHGNSLITASASQPIHGLIRYSYMGLDHFTRMPYPYCYRCKWNYKEGLYGKRDPKCNIECFDIVKQYILGMAPKRFAGIMLEPIQAGGGQIPAPPMWLRKLKYLCESEKIFLIYDECQTSAWRTGRYFTITEKYEKEFGLDVSPDMITYTKGIGGGFPLGILIASQDIKHQFNPSEEHTTFSSTPIGIAASLTALEVMEKENIGENSEKMGTFLTKRLKELQDNYDEIGDIRGPGLFIGVEMITNKDTREPYSDICEEMVRIAPDFNLYLGKSMPITTPMGKSQIRNVIMIKPPLIINNEQCEFLLERFEKILKQARKNLK